MNRVPGSPVYRPHNLVGMLPELERVDELARSLERLETDGMIAETGAPGQQFARQPSTRFHRV